MERVGEAVGIVRVTEALDALAHPHPASAGVDRLPSERGLFGARRLGSTPGRWFATVCALAVLVIVAGVVTTQSVASRKDTHDRLLTTTEPFVTATQQLYSSLSVADAAAATAFISGGIEPVDVRDRYLSSMADASAQLSAAAAGATEDEQRTAITRISVGIGTYSGMIEAARTNNRMGNPVGVSYLGAASEHMQSTLLPAAQRLHDSAERVLSDTQQSAVRPPWLAISTLLATVCALAFLHFRLARRTRRIVNVGVAVSVLASGALLLWVLVAGLLSSFASRDAIDSGGVPGAELAHARILAQQARTAETLQIARRDMSGAYQQTFDDRITQLGAVMARHVDSESESVAAPVRAAQEARETWASAHGRITSALDRGDFAAAAALTTGPGRDEATAAFGHVDAALTDAVSAARTELRGDEARAARILSALAPTAIVATVVALIALIAGIAPRLQEYR